MLDCEDVLGALLVGIIFNTYLFGLVSVQYLAYYNTKFKDALTVRLAVFILFLNDTFQSAVMIYMGWDYCINNSPLLEIFGRTIWPYAYIPIGTALTAMVCHLAMGRRIYHMSKSRILYLFALFGSFGALATGIAYGSGVWMRLPRTDTHVSLKTLVAWWLGIQAVLDIAIAGLMIAFLYKHRTGSSNTDTVINRLIRGSIRTGVLPTMFAVAALVTFLIRPESILYIMFVVPIGRLYTTSFMSSLNVRRQLKEKLSCTVEADPVISVIVWRDMGKSVVHGHSPPNSPVDMSSSPLSLRPGPKEADFNGRLGKANDTLPSIPPEALTTNTSPSPTRYQNP